MDKKEKLQGMLDQIDEKTGTKSVRSARQERIEKLVREMSDDADIKEELVRTRLTFRKYLTEFATKIGSLDGIVDAIKRNKVEYPKQIDVKVTNTHDMPKPVFNVPSLFDIRKPTWIDTITSPIKAVNSKMDQVLQAIKNVKMSEDPEKPIAVRLSDGKKFYEAITQVFGGTQGNIINIPKVTLSGGQQAIPVVNPDGTDISGGSGGGDGAIADGVTAAIKATVLDYTSSNPLAVRLTDTGGDYVAAGAGTQYTEDAAAAANPVGGTVILVREDGRAGSLTTTDGDNVALRGNNKGEAYVKTTDSDALLTTIDADTGNISTKIDTIAGAVAGTEMQVDVVGALPAGTNAIGKLAANSGVDIGDVDVTSIPGIAGTVAAGASDSGNPVKVGGIYESTLPTYTTGQRSDLHTGSRGLLMIEGGTAGGSTMIGNPIVIGLRDTSANAQSLAAIAAGDAQNGSRVLAVGGYVYNGSTYDRMYGNTTDGLLVNLGTNNDVSLNAGTNAIGKLAANSGVDIGDVDVTSISAGTNAIGNVGLIGRTTGGLTIFRSLDIDESEEEVKATAGQVFTITAFNTTAAPLYLKFYNATAASVTVGSTTPVLTFLVPGNADSDGAGFVHSTEIGYAFGTAITVACTTAIADADTGAPGANACLVNIGYM